MCLVQAIPSLGEFAHAAAAEIFNPYAALQVWAGTPGPRHRNIRFLLHTGSQLKKSSIIAVKSPPGFAAEPSGSHVSLQQGASAILRIAESFLQYVHDIHANVKANEIRQLQRSHGMVHS